MGERFMFGGLRGIGLVALVGGMIFAAGCGRATAVVSGKVTYKGTPVPSGTVTFFSTDGTHQDSGQLDADGNYTLHKCPVGDVVVTVATPMAAPRQQQDSMELLKKGMQKDKKPDLSPEAEAKMKEMQAGKKGQKVVPVPDKYRKQETSGLKLKVVAGKQQIDIPLE